VLREGTFDGQVVLVSGGTGGIGVALARGFRDLGASVVATGSTAERVRAAAEDPANAGIRFDRLDVRSGSAVGEFFAGLGALSVLVNAAGISRPGRELDEAVFVDVIGVNLTSVLRTCAAARTLLTAGPGSIVNVASMLSYLGDPRLPAYGAAKTGVIGLTRTLAHTFGADGIRVNAVAPGYHVTEMTRGAWSHPARAAAIADRSALKRWGTPEELVDPVLFLASPGAGFITGATLPVDGGYGVGNVLP
jgi:NAD(P)-dependent dehydrogenase (short-subunit alcohol dehydrogenase family)